MTLRKPGRPRDPRLAPKRDTIGLRPHTAERLEWERAANFEGVKLHTWIRGVLNAAAAASKARRTPSVPSEVP